MKTKRHLVLLLIGVISFTACKDDNPAENQPPVNTYPVPVKTDDGWDTASLAEVGIDEAPLLEMLDFINSTENHQIHDILIIKNNKLVFEEYFEALNYTSSPPANGTEMIQYDMNMLHYWASGSKSVSSLLFGIAVDKGYINSDMNEKISNYFTDCSSILVGDKADITVKHLLTMTSGLDFDETTYPYSDARNDIRGLFSASNPIKFVLSKNMHAAPGTVFHYNSGVTNVFADIIRRESGMTLLQFAEEFLFEPLGITDYDWQRIRGVYYFASGGLSLRPRDMAKIGSLILNDGKWKDTRIVSGQWLNESTQSYIVPNVFFANGYGYQWWLNTLHFGDKSVSYIQAAGLGEQLMFIVPSDDLIIVFNCGYFSAPVVISPYQLVSDYIARAVFPD